MTVFARTARIGDGRSTFQTGLLSHLNGAAKGQGATVGMKASRFAVLVAELGNMR